MIKMGWFSKNEEDKSTTDNKGQINNNINVIESVPIHNDMFLYILIAILILKVITLIIKLIKAYNKWLEKKHVKKTINNLQLK